MSIETLMGYGRSLFKPKIIEDAATEFSTFNLETKIENPIELEENKGALLNELKERDSLRLATMKLPTSTTPPSKANFHQVIHEGFRENLEKIFNTNLVAQIKEGAVDKPKYQQLLADLTHIYLCLEHAEENLRGNEVEHCLIDQLRRSEALGRDCEAWKASGIAPSSKAQRFGDAIVQCSLDQKEMLLAYMHFLYSIPMVVKLNPTSATKLIHPETLGTSQNSGNEFYHFEDKKKLKLEFITKYKEVASKIPDLSKFELSFSDMLKYHAREASLKFLRIIESIEKE